MQPVLILNALLAAMAHLLLASIHVRFLRTDTNSTGMCGAEGIGVCVCVCARVGADKCDHVAVPEPVRCSANMPRCQLHCPNGNFCYTNERTSPTLQGQLMLITHVTGC